MKEAIEQLQKLVPWAADLPMVPKIIVTVILILIPSLLLVLIWTPTEARRIELSKDKIKDILQLCYRRSIFTRTHAQLNIDAMFGSIDDCRSEIQRIIPAVESSQLQQIASNVLASLDLIMRYKDNPDFEKIDEYKLEALRNLGQLSRKTGLAYEIIPNLELRTDIYFSQGEADRPPGNDRE